MPSVHFASRAELMDAFYAPLHAGATEVRTGRPAEVDAESGDRGFYHSTLGASDVRGAGSQSHSLILLNDGANKSRSAVTIQLGVLAAMNRFWKTPIVTAAALVGLTAANAWAGGTHDHPMENGTADAPLDISRAANDLPAPLGVRAPQTIKVDLETVEVTGRLADGVAYHYWTFGTKVPGPFVRARVGDTIEVTLTNRADRSEKHSVDFHAATAPGGGQRRDRGRARRKQDLHVQGNEAGALCLSLCGAGSGRAYRQWHVRSYLG